MELLRCEGCGEATCHRENGLCQNCLRKRKAARGRATKANRRKERTVTAAEAFRLLNEGKAWVRH